MPECSVCGPVDEPLAVHVTTKQHQDLAAMEQDLAAETENKPDD